MVFGTLFVAPSLPAQGALGLNDFEVGGDESLGSGTESVDIVGVSNSGRDWTSLSLVSGSFDPGEVKVINDQNFTGTATVYSNPETAADDFCTTDNDLITKNGTKIDDYPFETVSGSPSPGKNDICQVYVSYEIEGDDVILYMGVVRRETGGTTAVALELNKVNQANRADGDLLVAFEFDGSGPVSDLAVRMWNGTSWIVQDVSGNWAGTSWEHFGEVAVNLSDTDLLPPPTSVDDCSSFSSILPYGFAGNSDSSNVGDWGGEVPIDIPRCGEIRITKDATPAAGSSYVFEWELSDNDGVLTSASDTIVDGETDVLDVVAGEYTLAEIVEASPYQLDRIECTDGQKPVDFDEITVAVGDTVYCTIFNVAPQLIVSKTTINDDGGTAQDGDFQLYVNDVAVAQDTAIAGIAADTEYTITEDLLDGYEQVSIVCIDDDTGADVGHPVTLSEDQAVTCTVTNDDIAPQLTLLKDVITDDGGDAVDTDWTLSADGPESISGVEGDASITDAEVTAGTYDLSESGGPSAYTASDWVCDGGTHVDGDTVTLALGDVATCEITNDDVPPGLTVVKEVINDDGGDAVAGDFQLYVNGSAVDQGSPLDVDANVQYTVSEDQVDGYVLTGIACEDSEGAVSHPVTLSEGQAVLCTVTNDDIAPELTVLKDVTNDDGGTAVAGDFQLYVNGSPVTQGVATEVLANTEYTVTEDLLEGYIQTGLTCVDDDTEQTVAHPVTLDEGQRVTCTISNDDGEASITVIKTVLPVDAADPDDFDLTITPEGGDPIATLSGETQGVAANTTYTVGETLPAGFVQVDLSCVDEQGPVAHPVDLQLGQNVTCTIVNEQQVADLSVTKVDDVDPVALTEDDPVAEVTYTITVTNLGPSTAEDAVVTDSLPMTMTFVSASPSVGSCSHAGGVVTCSLGDLAVGDEVSIEIVVETQAFGEVTDFEPINLVEVSSVTLDPNIDNNHDTEPTAITEVLDVEVLPFTGVYAEHWFFLAIAWIGAGVALLLISSRRSRDLDQPTYPG